MSLSAAAVIARSAILSRSSKLRYLPDAAAVVEGCSPQQRYASANPDGGPRPPPRTPRCSCFPAGSTPTAEPASPTTPSSATTRDLTLRGALRRPTEPKDRPPGQSRCSTQPGLPVSRGGFGYQAPRAAGNWWTLQSDGEAGLRIGCRELSLEAPFHPVALPKGGHLFPPPRVEFAVAGRR